ncbi:hypothetical protein OG559_13575 [Micromonospora sp. NBC_01405]|uniref:hypothetical protein n=1 Tax=Micromonospora sp. NBC_01405 TaxID=2903589 RepID=UPI00324BE18B
MQRIAPSRLQGREQELNELAEFCIGDHERSYMWWRAPAWAGKSALMSWFVLYPPPGIRVVSFFVTARLASQNDRGAFTDVLLEQLLDLLDQPLPAYLTEATREAHLLGLLEQAAMECQQHGERLVLLVDGLDEDTGTDTHSIAAMLPARPPMGMRVIVAGRLNPPVPSEVSIDHPLHDAAIVRNLASSPYAAAVRRDAERELRRLLTGSESEQDLLGLITVAGGGLSVGDLAELMNCRQWQVEEHLGAVPGRTFDCRPGHWNASMQVYVLGHEELQRQATQRLGDGRLQTYRQRLHTWADDYHTQGWPVGTPEYLLRDYRHMLQASEDLARLIVCALDAARHDRMLQYTGGDVAAIEEINAVQDAILAQAEPDLLAMCQLAVHRESLIQRNTNIPLALPKLRAILGDVSRAEAMAQSITDVNHRAVAVALLVPTVAAAGHYDRAQELACSIPSPLFIESSLQAQTLAGLVETLARVGDYTRADSLTQDIDSPFWRDKAHAVLAIELARAGQIGIAESRIRVISNPYWQAQAFGVLARTVASAGVADQAEALAAHAAEVARTVVDSADRALVLGLLMRFAAEEVDVDQSRVESLAAAVESEIRSITDPLSQVITLTKLVPLLIKAGRHARINPLLRQAEVVARGITEASKRDEALSALAPVVATIGDHDKAEELARLVAGSYSRASALIALTSALVAEGNYDRAEACARTITDPHRQAKALGKIVPALAKAGKQQQAKEIPRRVTDVAHRAEVLTEWALALAADGDHARAATLAEQAEHLARSRSNLKEQADVLSTLVSALAVAGDNGRAAAIGELAGALARSITSDSNRTQVLKRLVPVLLSSGNHDLAESLVRVAPNSRERVTMLIEVMVALANRGDRSRAMGLVEQIEAAVGAITVSSSRRMALTQLITQLGQMGEYDRASVLVDSLEESYLREKALNGLVQIAVDVGEYGKAEALAKSLTSESSQANALTSLMKGLVRGGQVDRAEVMACSLRGTYRDRILVQLTTELADVGRHDRADAVARLISNPDRQSQALIMLAQKTEPPHARLLIAQALRRTSWADSLEVLARLHPDAVYAVADGFLHAAGVRQPDQIGLQEEDCIQDMV